MAAVGVGTRCLAIGAGGEADGFPRIARLTTIMADGAVTARDKALMEFGVLTVIGAAPTKVGMVPARKLPPPLDRRLGARTRGSAPVLTKDSITKQARVSRRLSTFPGTRL